VVVVVQKQKQEEGCSQYLFGHFLEIKYCFYSTVFNDQGPLIDTMENATWTFLQNFTPEFQAMRSGLQST
jgi:hypothetical protein